MQSAAAASERVFDFLEEEKMEDESQKTEYLSNVRGEVEFCHVKFAYPNLLEKELFMTFLFM